MSDSSQVPNELVAAIHAGDLRRIRQLVTDNPGLASRPLGDRFGSRTPLHVVADWPGYFPNGPEVVRVLVAAGADPDARQRARRLPCTGRPAATTCMSPPPSSTPRPTSTRPAARSARLSATPSATRAGTWPGCSWHGVPRWRSRGRASALGLVDRLDQLLGAEPSAGEVSKAFWHACSGGQRRTAEHLLSLGADPNWIPEYARGTPLDAAGGLGTQRENLIGWLRQHGAHPAATGSG